MTRAPLSWHRSYSSRAAGVCTALSCSTESGAPTASRRPSSTRMLPRQAIRQLASEMHSASSVVAAPERPRPASPEPWSSSSVRRKASDREAPLETEMIWVGSVRLTKSATLAPASPRPSSTPSSRAFEPSSAAKSGEKSGSSAPRSVSASAETEGREATAHEAAGRGEECASCLVPSCVAAPRSAASRA
eukprot:scaffold290392_cov30-Tisochrysis_lutea.AAC.1